jgi:alpha-amylase/alpha-mannosidase (GH57 family)
MYWANFLHIYQPPTQSEAIVVKVANECYRKLMRMLQNYPRAKLTLNINACLTEQLMQYGFGDIISELSESAQRGQVEFTASAMYHPILPLIPRSEMVRQIELNTAVNRRYFGDVYNPKGFFPPEMCYSFEVAEVVADLGYQWIVIDEIGYNGKVGSVAKDSLYRIEGLGDFYVFFKERPISTGIAYGSHLTADKFLADLSETINKEGCLLTGTDGELYGHHRPGQERLLEDIYSQGLLPTCTISELLSLFSKVKTANPLPSSWSTWEDEMAQGAPYSLWSYPGNELHELQWRLTELAIDTIANLPQNTPSFEQARQLLDRGIYSCQYWWASCRPWWDTGMVQRGAKTLLEAIERVAEIAPQQWEQAQELYRSIYHMVWNWQDTGKAQRLKEEYLLSHPQITSELTFGEHP